MRMLDAVGGSGGGVVYLLLWRGLPKETAYGLHGGRVVYVFALCAIGALVVRCLRSFKRMRLRRVASRR
jgi:hypothetical protein